MAVQIAATIAVFERCTASASPTTAGAEARARGRSMEKPVVTKKRPKQQINSELICGGQVDGEAGGS